MIGRQLKLMHREVVAEERKPSLLLEHVTMQKKDKRMLTDVSMHIAPGEILGIAGIAGSGQRELLEAIAGLQHLNDGKARLVPPSPRGKAF